VCRERERDRKRETDRKRGMTLRYDRDETAATISGTNYKTNSTQNPTWAWF
jgi:hypothetical protein